jgi:hypothetical protein
VLRQWSDISHFTKTAFGMRGYTSFNDNTPSQPKGLKTLVTPVWASKIPYFSVTETFVLFHMQALLCDIPSSPAENL